MSKTLFWYILRDLLKIFLMTSGVLAGIFSFAGLLKPLIQVGLSGSQMLEMLGDLMPAMQTFTLPIAALFATTMVYGRLSADNELTACRATGISFGALTLPALVLGLTLSLVTLLSLSFVVPRYMLKAEKVMFSSLAEAIKKNIEREHKIKLPDHTIYAEKAERRPSPADAPEDEILVLYRPIICSLDTAPPPGALDANGRPLKTGSIPVPNEFYTAKEAIVRIHQARDPGGRQTHVEVSAVLDGGVRFPRKLEGEAIAGVSDAEFGPVQMDSPIRENTTFMTVEQLQALYQDPLLSRELGRMYIALNRSDQEKHYIEQLHGELADRAEKGHRPPPRRHEYTFVGSDSTALRLRLDPNVRLVSRGEDKLTFNSLGATRGVHLDRVNGDEVLSSDDARMVSIQAQADQENWRMRVKFDLEDVLVGATQGKQGRPSFSRTFSVPMTAEVASIMKRDPHAYLNMKGNDGARFRRKFSVLLSGIRAELHWRVAFAISCLILVMIGCTLGMMFRTGNFLSAFALSVVPALLCIVLMITGKHVSEQDAKNLKLGLTLIWTGNVVVFGLAVTLLGRLHRQ